MPHLSHRSLQHRLVLKEVQMTPLPLPDVVNAASFGAAGRTDEPTAARETDVQLKLLPLRIELGPQHDPWSQKPQRRLEKLSVSHPSKLPDSRSCPITQSQRLHLYPHETATSRQIRQPYT